MSRKTSERSARRRETMQSTASDVIISFTPASLDLSMKRETSAAEAFRRRVRFRPPPPPFPAVDEAVEWFRTVLLWWCRLLLRWRRWCCNKYNTLKLL